MGIKDTLVAAVGTAAGEIMKGFDGLFTSDDERLSAQAKLTKIMNELTTTQLTHVDNQEKERSERHKSDMQADSWLSKNVRPLTLIALMVFFAIIVLVDSSTNVNFKVEDKYVSLLESLMLTAFSFYFVMRGVEKITAAAKAK